MTLLSSFLSQPEVKKVLAQKPGQEGFSLIELVVVVAVLAVLSAIAIPQFTNISMKARASAASNTLATMAKECAVKLAEDGSGTINIPDLQGYQKAKTASAGFYHDAHDATGGVSSSGTYVAPGGTFTCANNKIIGFVSDNTAEYPSFYYNTKTAKKVCTAQASSAALDGRGCDTGTTW